MFQNMNCYNSIKKIVFKNKIFLTIAMNSFNFWMFFFYAHHLQFTHLPSLRQILLALITDRGIRNFNQTPFSPLTAFVGSPPGAVIA